MRFNWLKTATSRQKIGLILILVGLVCFAAVFSFKADHKLTPELKKEESVEPLYPSQIIIPKVRVNLQVLPAKLVNDEWEIPATSAAYLLGSGLPGQPGNVVIYGHNKNNLLGPIRWLGKDSEIKLVNKKGEEFIYQATEAKTVAVKNVAILAPTPEATLTLYTCSGVLDSQRFVVVAKLKVLPK